MNRSRGIDRASVPYADYLDWRTHRDVFSGVALYRPVTLDLSGTGVPEQLQAVGVTEEYFPVIGTRPIAGRVFNADDHAAAASRVAVISDRLWRTRFGAERSLIGGTVRLGGDTVAVVGRGAGATHVASGCGCVGADRSGDDSG